MQAQEMQTKGDCEPDQKRGDRGRKRIPMAAHEQPAHHYAVDEECDGAQHHGFALRKRIVSTVLPESDAKCRQCDRGSRPEQSGKAFRPENVAHDGEDRNGEATHQEAGEIFHHAAPVSCPLAPFRVRPSVIGRTSRSSKAPAAKPAATSLAQCASSRMRVAESVMASPRAIHRCDGGNRLAAEASAPMCRAWPEGKASRELPEKGTPRQWPLTVRRSGRTWSTSALRRCGRIAPSIETASR